MLAEALLYARARLAGQHDRHGHLTELVGIWARYRRQRNAWAEHLARARMLCLRAAEACPGHRTALVLGAGLLHDVPLEVLARLFRRVVLADLAFLPPTISLARGLGNVELVLQDLTGCMDDLPSPDELAARAPAPVPDLALGLPELDFVYSANLLSQLPLYAMAVLRRRVSPPGEEDLEAYAASLIRAHLAGLARLPCPACLVTDLREHGAEDGEPCYESDVLFGAQHSLRGETWTWRLAPRGELRPGLEAVRTVLGVDNVNRAAARGRDHG
ncbi:hypothetical protein SAMN04488503_1739 [Humidesulfovibrio mexicanus]|uniref:Uncharacterized protein n=1 Tax=Humidesulfovibrio mexicanus TaxID=147047 RepID=A0A239A1T0_9BACT|nr:hypothetical protein [Humidesulfovibrio mexicanus]SNR88974.1 hypothetical protein SAMN04488503_1739 [Humidesulfovibrio mexicanus]